MTSAAPADEHRAPWEQAAPAQAAPTPTPAEPRDAPPSAAKSAPASQEPGGLLAGILAAHNRYRQDHCAPPLTWSAELARVAQSWADTLRRRNCAFEHNPDTPHGENLAFASPPGSIDAERVVKGWYSEVSLYDFKKPRFDFATGHFTQVVWTRTTELGCGVARCDNAEIWVCNYNPAGNYQNQFRDHVKPATCRR